MADASSSVLVPLVRAVARARAGLALTPGRLRLAALLVVLGAAVFAAVGSSAVSGRRDAARSAASETEPLLVAAEGLYGSLSDADATAATTFLTGGLEPPARRARYTADLRAASGQLATLTHTGASVQAQAAVRTLATDLPVYSGLVETARANNRQGFPVGAAYLRQASALMREQMLPAAGRLYEAEARRLSSDYDAGVSAAALVAIIIIVVSLLGLLAAIERYLYRLTSRVFNVPMVLATMVVLALSVWLVTGALDEQGSLERARQTGSDSVQVLSAARILALRAQGDEGLALVARGGGEADLADFEAASGRLGSTATPGGLLAEAAAVARRSGTVAAVDRLSGTFARYQAAHRRIATAESDGRFSEAVSLAAGPHAHELSLSDALNSELVGSITVAQRRFASAASAAGSALAGLWLAIPLLAALSAALALWGLANRLREYR